MSSSLFGDALGRAGSLSGGKTVNIHENSEMRCVVGPSPRRQSVKWSRKATALRPFLQSCLGVLEPAARSSHAMAKGGPHHTLGGCGAAIEENRANDRFAHIPEDCVLISSASLGFPFSQPNVRSHIPIPRHLRASFLPHQRGETAGHQTLAVFCKRVDQHMRDCQPEHAVAKELQSFVRLRARGSRAYMRQRQLEQLPVIETMPDSLLKNRQIAADALSHGQCRQWADFNRRSQRTDHGQRQNANGDSSFFTEKKIRSARPTRFT